MTKKEIYLVLDNIRSAHNVGSIFRTADAAGVAKIYLCGFTPLPESHGRRLGTQKLSKTSLGAEKTVPWEHYEQTWRLLEKLKTQGVCIVAVEVAPKARNIFKYKPRFPVALVFGHEVKGLSKPTLKYANDVVEIPMHGKKESLNVSVAAGIAVYQIKNSR